MYQRMKAMLTTELPDQDTLQFVCNKVATTGLHCLNIPAVMSLETHSILTDVMLTPLHMGGAGMETPTWRLCQDLSIGILSGLAHPAPVVRETFNYVMNEATDFNSANGKRSKVEFCRHVAELNFHRGSQDCGRLIEMDTFNPAQRHLCSNLPPVMVGLQAESSQQRNTTMYPDCLRSATLKQYSQVLTAREPEATLVADESADQHLQPHRDETASHAQALSMHSDTVWMGLNMKQEESWKTSGIVCLKGHSSCTIPASV